MSMGPEEEEEEEEEEEADFDSCLASSSVVAIVTPSLGLSNGEERRGEERGKRKEEKEG